MSSFVPPRVWKPPPSGYGGAVQGQNLPTADPRHDRPLPRGKHDLQLYSKGTPNGIKVTVLLEELHDAIGLEYDAWNINLGDGDQFGAQFTAICPNQKIPAMLDYSPNGKAQGEDAPVRVFESAAILVYLAEKYNMFLPTERRARAECLNWVFWLQGSAPYIGGGFGHFYAYAPFAQEYPINRFTMELKRILHVLERHLADGRRWVCGDDITIADFCIFPWMRAPLFYNAREFIQFDEYQNIQGWLARVMARPAVQRGLRVNGMGRRRAVLNRHSAADFDEAPRSKL